MFFKVAHDTNIVYRIMKKMIILFMVMMSTIISFGQVQEVRGVETKLVVYDGPEYSGSSFASEYKRSYTSTEWFGYSFYNMNSISVSVEAELYIITEYGEEKIKDTKTFNLKPNETYIWKQETLRDFQVHTTTAGHYSDWSIKGKPKPGPWNSYYVKYKAYKIL